MTSSGSVLEAACSRTSLEADNDRPSRARRIQGSPAARAFTWTEWKTQAATQGGNGGKMGGRDPPVIGSFVRHLFGQGTPSVNPVHDASARRTREHVHYVR